jgi:hypothetical protein
MVVLFVTLTTLNTGCKDPSQKDVTNDPNYGDFSRVVGTWNSKTPLELAQLDKELYLCPKGGLTNGGARLILTLPAGTEIRVEHLYYHEVMGGSPTYMMGSLVTGPYAGKPIELGDDFFRPNPFTDPNVSKPPPDYTFKWTVSPDMLTR